MATIHPTACVDPKATVADDAAIGPGCVVEGGVQVGPRCRLREYVILRRGTRLGADNAIWPFCVLGDEPQDLKFDPATETELHIGNGNTFREGVTISRGSKIKTPTTVGNNTYWMANAHAGHDATINDDCILTNAVAIGGHATVGRGAVLSASTLVHQHTWIGERVMTRGNSGFSAHLPPFVIGRNINGVVGLNVVGLKRAADITDEDRAQIKEAYNLVYRRGLPLGRAIEEMDAHSEWGAPAGRFREFMRAVHTAKPPHKRGLARPRAR
ncbi:MAG: acyl-ACP--UDP-N-acetylglucosamine O-acyltransferase [Phycisphaerae bacterium]|nr:acyl-ACP--UDP-N-acetylglucosamine O-acyltransferase [Phycisphaerae bacterium]